MTTAESSVTALIKIAPDSDATVIALREQVLGLLRYAETRVIETQEHITPVTEDLSLISNLKKAIEEKRKEYVGPINDHLKAVNDAFKLLTEILAHVDKILHQKVYDYWNEQEKVRYEQERTNAVRYQAAQNE